MDGRRAFIVFHDKAVVPGKEQLWIWRPQHFEYKPIAHLELVKRIEEGRLEEAENLLFDRLDPADPDTLKVALDFYARLEKLDPAYLSAHGFTEDDIALGLAHAAAAFGHDDAARVFLTFLSEKER